MVNDQPLGFFVTVTRKSGSIITSLTPFLSACS